MFVSFLYPFRLRNRTAPYLWIGYKQITDLSPDEVCFICSSDYFADPAEYQRAGRFECLGPVNPELGFRVPKPQTLSEYDRYFVPECIYRRLKQRLVSDSLVWLDLITNIDEELVIYLLERFERIGHRASIDALLTWCNFASLEEAGRRAQIPVIHTELGPLRWPRYKPLGYLDFSGVNGNTEAERRFRRYARPADHSEFLPRAQLLPTLLREPLPPPGPGPGFEIGIPLQVEDDSNVLAYGKGFDLPLVIQYAQEQVATDALLIRPHPGAYFHWSGKGLATDDSANAMAFVQRCRGLLTLNSSVAVEAMLAGIPVTVLGESPARFAAANSLEQPRKTTDAELDFLLLNYCVPYGLLFDRTYLLWRLTNPSESDIRRRHLLALTEYD